MRSGNLRLDCTYREDGLSVKILHGFVLMEVQPKEGDHEEVFLSLTWNIKKYPAILRIGIFWDMDPDCHTPLPLLT